MSSVQILHDKLVDKFKSKYNISNTKQLKQEVCTILSNNITKRKLNDLDTFIKSKQRSASTPSTVYNNTLKGNDNNQWVMHTPQSSTLRRNQSSSMSGLSGVKTSQSLGSLLKNEQDYTLVSRWRERETQQLDQYKQMRKTQMQQMLKSNQDSQSDFKRTKEGFWSKEQNKPSVCVTQQIEEGRKNSTENWQKMKQPTLFIDKTERLNEIESRIKREKQVVEQEKQAYNKMLTVQNMEKQRELKKDVQRLLKNKEQFEKTRLEIEKLKLEKQRLMVKENDQEKQQIDMHVKELDIQIQDKIKKKQEELQEWNMKMDALLNNQNLYQNEHKELNRADWEDTNIQNKERDIRVAEQNKRTVLEEYKMNNKHQLMKQIEDNRSRNQRDGNAIAQEKMKLTKDVTNQFDGIQKEQIAKRKAALENKKKLYDQIQYNAVLSASGNNNMIKEFNLNKNFITKIKNEMQI